MLHEEYGIHPNEFPPRQYPFGWLGMKDRIKSTFASSFAASYVWRDLTNLKRGRDIAAFQTRFIELARLVGETPDTATYGSRLWDIYCGKMTEKEDDTLGNLIQTCRQLDKKPRLRDAMAILDERNLRAGGNAMYQKPSTANPGGEVATSTNLIPGPMELGAMSGIRSTDTCARCKGEGHWTSVCPTPRHWKKGEKVAGYKPRYEGARGGHSKKEFGHKKKKESDNRKAQSYSTELDPGENSGEDVSTDAESDSDSDSDGSNEGEAGKA
jgi:hypothetical protein